MLNCQVRELLKECPDELFGDGLPNCRVDALLEAWLVHIRLLDEFLRTWGTHRGAESSQWGKFWKSDGILTETQRQAVNAQVAHLGWDRKRWTETVRPPWERQIRAWTTACCEGLKRFVVAIPPARRPAFEKALSTADDWLNSQVRKA